MIKCNVNRSRTCKKSKKKPQSFNIIKDIDAVVSSFKNVYNIDITRERVAVRYFIALFKNLPRTAPICEIIALRETNPSEIKDIELIKYRNSILLKDEKNEEEDQLIIATKAFSQMTK